MILYHLHYQWQENEETLNLKEEGIFYLDLSEPRIRLFNNPSEGPQVLLIVTAKQVFLASHGKGFNLSPEMQTIDGLKVSVVPTDDFLSFDYKKYWEQARALVARYGRRRRVWLGAALACLALVVLVVMLALKSPTAVDYQSEIDTLKDLQGQEMARKSMELAKHFFEKQNYVLTLQMIDRVLAQTPTDKQAVELQEKTLKRMDETKLAAQKNLKQDLRFQTLLDQAAVFMAQKDNQGALLSVEQVLEEDPKNSEALQMKSALERELEKTRQKQAEQAMQTQQKINEAEKLWTEGKEVFAAKDTPRAFKMLSRAMELLEDTQAQPPFRVELKDILDQVREQIGVLVKPFIEKGRATRNEAEQKSDLARIVTYKEALEQYYEAQKIDPHYPRLADEISLTIQGFDKSFEAEMVEARTVLDLEGCCAAAPHFKKIMTLAKYEEVPSYKKAKQTLEQCPCE